MEDLLKKAFSDSANYSVWALISLLAAFVVLELYDKSSKKWFGRIITFITYILFNLVSLINIFFISGIFGEQFGTMIQYVSFVIITCILFFNAAQAASGMVGKPKDREEGKNNRHRKEGKKKRRTR